MKKNRRVAIMALVFSLVLGGNAFAEPVPPLDTNEQTKITGDASPVKENGQEPENLDEPIAEKTALDFENGFVTFTGDLTDSERSITHEITVDFAQTPEVVITLVRSGLSGIRCNVYGENGKRVTSLTTASSDEQYISK